MPQVRGCLVLSSVSRHIYAQRCLPCLIHLMLLHVHKDRIDGLKLVDIANNFSACNDHRKHVLGTVWSTMTYYTVNFHVCFLSNCTNSCYILLQYHSFAKECSPLKEHPHPTSCPIFLYRVKAYLNEQAPWSEFHVATRGVLRSTA